MSNQTRVSENIIEDDASFRQFVPTEERKHTKDSDENKSRFFEIPKNKLAILEKLLEDTKWCWASSNVPLFKQILPPFRLNSVF